DKDQIELVEGKILNIIGDSLKRFLTTLGNKRIKIKIDDIIYEPNILYKDLPISFNIEDKNDKLVISSDENMPIPLNEKADVFFYNGDIYLPSINQYSSYKHFYKHLKEDNSIKFDKSKVQEVITKVIPKLEQASLNVSIDENI
ncbi:SNF2 helicase associated domain-containing protein, partial [Romboutsia sp. 1001216sp1]